MKCSDSQLAERIRKQAMELVLDNDTYVVEPIDPYPVMTRDIILSGLTPHGYRGNLSQVFRGLQRALTDGVLNVSVLGGSVPAGSGLKPGEDWPSVLRTTLGHLLPAEMPIHVTNLAQSGVPSLVQAHADFSVFLPTLLASHLVVVDITVNDNPEHDLLHPSDQSAEGRLLMELLITFTPNVGVLYLETFSRMSMKCPCVTKPSDLDVVHKSRGVIAHGKFVHSHCPINISHYFHWEALLSLRIPILSYPDIACRFNNASAYGDSIASNAAVGFWGTRTHPPANVHKYIAQVVGLSVLELFRDTLDDEAHYPIGTDSTWKNFVLEKPAISVSHSLMLECGAHPTSEMSSLFPEQFKPLRHGSDWSFKEDVKGKPGWIADIRWPKQRVNMTGDMREIVFPVKLRGVEGKGRVELGVLRSYDPTMGILKCCMDCLDVDPFAPTHAFVMRHSDRTSQVYTVWLNVDVDAGVPVNHGGGTSIANATLHVLRCRADFNKVKITSVVGC